MFETATQNLSATLGSELTNALFVAVVYGLILSDLRKYLSIEKFFEKLNINNIFIKIICFIFYYLLLITIGLFGLMAILLIFELL